MFRERIKIFVEIAAVAMMAVSCGNETVRQGPVDYYNEDHVDFEFLTFGAGTVGVTAFVKSEAINICLSGASSATLSKWQGWIQDAVLKWIKPMRALTSSKLADKVNIITNGSGTSCHASVSIVNGAWGYATITARPVITVGPNIPFGVLIHEFGHAFGLADTYLNGTSGYCRSGQPQSLMCNISFNDLQPDDVAGVTAIFKSKYPNDRPPVPQEEIPVPEDEEEEEGNSNTPPDIDGSEEMSAAVSLFKIADDSYQLYIAIASAKSLAKPAMEYCLGSAAACKGGQSEFHSMIANSSSRDGDRYIYAFRAEQILDFLGKYLLTTKFSDGQGKVYYNTVSIEKE